MPRKDIVKISKRYIYIKRSLLIFDDPFGAAEVGLRRWCHEIAGSIPTKGRIFYSKYFINKICLSMSCNCNKYQITSTHTKQALVSSELDNAV